jgi:endonuclease YncB( thermonuclease family)
MALSFPAVCPLLLVCRPKGQDKYDRKLCDMFPGKKKEKQMESY